MRSVTFTKAILFAILFFASYNSVARKFYFSSTTGNDSYATNSITTPWKTLIKLQSCVIMSANVFHPGDSILFKRGDIFDNGHDAFASMAWQNDPVSGYTAPSGTASSPIVFSNYGDPNLPLPNFLFPRGANGGSPNTIGHSRHTLYFAGVSFIVFDGLQFNDFRFPYADKVTTAYTATGLHLGEHNGNPLNYRVRNMVVKNCNFSNIGYGIMSCGSYIQISNNNFTNMKSVGDTSGNGLFSDVGSSPVQPEGDHYLIDHNYMKGGWSYSSRNATGMGMVGGTIEVLNDFDSSKVIYNTFVDCQGLYEFGNNTGDNTLGPNDDTTAYNLCINIGLMAYIHTGTSQFAAKSANLHFWNNVYIENNNSRFSGPKFGQDIYGDGQSFHNFPDWPVYPKNNSDSNYNGRRLYQYMSETMTGNPDTLVDSRNNIYWNTTGLQQNYDVSRLKSKHANNIYHLVGGYRFPTILGSGAALNTGNYLEISTNAKIFRDTSNIDPELWDFHLDANSPAINFGRGAGLTNDFAGMQIVGNPDAGIYEYNSSTIPTVLNATSTQTAITCFGGSTSITVSATGGTAPYTGTGVFTVSAGNYAYIVTDASGTRDTVNVSITQPTAITVSVSSGTITTTGGTTSVLINATGGTGSSYTYSLDAGVFQTSPTFNNVSSGNHNVNVKDANGCVVLKSFFINAPVVSTLIATATSGAISCNGGTTTVTVSATGGTAPYTGTGTFSANAGLHTYTVTDINGNTQSTSVTLTQPTAITVSLVAGTIAVYGGSTTITVTSTGGTGTRTFKLDNGSFQTSNIFSNVLAGVHSITVMDANGCTQTGSITINQPAAIALSINTVATSILCSGNTSIITITASGGTAPYTGTGSFTVFAGVHSYTVTDAVGTTRTSSINVSEPSSIIINASSGTITTLGGTTSITVSAVGGTSPYTYKLNGGTPQTSNVFNNVIAGNHNISVSDLNGCTKSTTLSITQPSSNLVANVTTGTISCNGGSTNVVVNATGGTAPYTGTGTFNATAGLHTYTVTDANGITQSNSITITQPTSIVVSSTAGIISTYGGTTSITVNSSGGTSPYTYTLDNGTYQTTNIFNNVIAGTHTIVVKDANGCVANYNTSITQPSNNPMVVTAVGGTISCFGGTALVTVSATGGTPPYTGTGAYSIGGGTRTFTVRDANGTVQTTTITISSPTEIFVNVSVASDISALGGTTPVSVNATGGTGSFRYSLDGGVSQTTSSFRAVGAGNHYITVVDANGCVKVATFTVNQLETTGFTVSLVSKTNATCKGARDGSIEVVAAGGRAPYTYSIGTGTYGINYRFYNLRAGIYRVHAKDANNNIADIIVVIADGKRRCPNTGRLNSLIINAFPNPSAQYFNLTIDSDSDEDINVNVIDLNGRIMFTDKGIYNRGYRFGENFKPGVYFVRVLQGDQMITQKVIKL